MKNKIDGELTVGGVSIMRFELPLNPDATLVTGVDVTVKGLGLNTVDPLALNADPADTKLRWECPAPVVVPQEEA